MIRLLAIAAAMAVVGCADGSCKTRIDQMEARFARAGGWTIGSVAKVELIEVGRDRASTELKSAAEIAVRHDGVELWGRRVNAADLDLELQRMNDERARRPAGAPTAILLAIDRRASMDLVRKIAAHFADDELQMVVALAGEKPIPPPIDRVQKVIDTISDSDPAERAVVVAEKTEEAIGECKPAAEVFGAVGSQSPAERAKTILRELPVAVRPCGCKQVDVAMLEGMILAIFGAYEQPRGWIPLDRAKLASAPNTAALR